MFIPLIVAVVLLIGIDQFTKLLAIKYLMPVGSVDIINNFFKLTYVENRGAAFGIMQGAKWVFVIIAVIILIFAIRYYIKLCKEKKNRLMRVSLLLVVSGAIGNVIDRVFRGYVVDLLDFNVFGYDFPVFNFADICVCVGAAIMIISVLLSKEDA